MKRRMKGILINKSQRLVCHFKQAIIWSSFCLINTKPLSPARSICWHHMHCGSQPGCKTDLSWGNIPKQLVVLPVLEILDWSRNTCPFIFWPFFPYTVTKINTLWNLWHELKRVQQVEVRWKGTHMVTSLKSQMNKEISQPQTHNCTKKKSHSEKQRKCFQVTAALHMWRDGWGFSLGKQGIWHYFLFNQSRKQTGGKVVEDW